MRALLVFCLTLAIYVCLPQTGKDRTGLIAMLLQLIAEVPEEVVLQDYSLTNVADPAKEMAEQADALSDMIGTGKILISFLQIFTSLQLTMDIPWSISFKQMMDF